MSPARLAVIVAIALTSASLADAQTFPRRDRTGSPRDATRDRDREAQRSPAPSGVEPFGALERELPSLNVDLQIRADQLDDWRRFERGIRDLAEMERSRRRHLLSLSDAGEKPPTAITFVGSLAEDDRLRAESSAELKRQLEALYARLDDRQRQMLDRRVVQSQTEPLGGAARAR